MLHLSQALCLSFSLVPRNRPAVLLHHRADLGAHPPRGRAIPAQLLRKLLADLH